MEVLPQKQLEATGYHQKSVPRPVTYGVSNKQTKQPLFLQTLCFGPGIHRMGYIYRFSGSSHTGKISFAQFCVCFVSRWHTPVSLSKHCPYRLLPGLRKRVTKFSSCRAPHKKSVRSHFGLYPVMALPVPCVKPCVTDFCGLWESPREYSPKPQLANRRVPVLQGPLYRGTEQYPCDGLGWRAIWRLLLPRSTCCVRIYYCCYNYYNYNYNNYYNYYYCCCCYYCQKQ